MSLMFHIVSISEISDLQSFLPDLIDAFVDSWQHYVDLYKSVDPPVGEMFQRYIEYCIRSDFTDVDVFVKNYASGSRRLFLAMDENGKVVGFCGGRITDSSSCELWRMGVRREWEGKGIASRLFDRVYKYAASYNCKTLWLTTGQIMGKAVQFYRKKNMVLVRKLFLPEVEISLRLI